MKRQTTMAFLAGVAVTGAFLAGMGMKESSAKPKIMNSGRDDGGIEWIMFESGEFWVFQAHPATGVQGWYRGSAPFDSWDQVK